jgi:Xaa-Pro aminopeptidase
LTHKDYNLNPVEVLVGVIKEKGLQNSRLGLDERGIPPQTHEYIQKALPQAVIVPAYQLWRQIRAVKTRPEVQRIRDVAHVNERALNDVYEAIRAGVDVRELLRLYLQRLTEYGGRFAYWDSGIGSESSSSFPSSAYAAQLGDLVRVDAACTRDYYYSDTGRTLILGEPNAKQLRYFGAIRAGIQNGLELVRPGASASEVFQGIMTTVKEEGIPQHKRSGCGHGIGLEFYEIPLINPIRAGKEDTLLEEGMVINLETPYYELGFGGIQIENTVLVTQDGCERLTGHSMDLITR